jgi:hypothetical protein
MVVVRSIEIPISVGGGGNVRAGGGGGGGGGWMDGLQMHYSESGPECSYMYGGNVCNLGGPCYRAL